MSGFNVWNSPLLKGAAFSSSLISSWPMMQAICPLAAAHDITSSDLPLLSELRNCYDGIRATRECVARIYSDFDATVSFDLHEGTRHTRFHPPNLPPAKAMPPLSTLYSPESKFTPPALRCPVPPTVENSEGANTVSNC